MSELMNKVTQDNVRAELNLVYAMMRFLATILSMASDSQLARDTLVSTAEGILEQAAILYRDIGNYASAVADDTERVHTMPCRSIVNGDECNETNNSH